MNFFWLVTLVLISTVMPDRSVQPQQDGEPIQTDAHEYALRLEPGSYEATAVATYTNSSGRPVYYSRCTFEATGPIYDIRRVSQDNGIDPHIGGEWSCVDGVSPGVVQPGETLTAEVWLGGMESSSATPPVRPEARIGRFRIEFDLYSDPILSTQLPIEQRQSNVFEVRFASR